MDCEYMPEIIYFDTSAESQKCRWATIMERIFALPHPNASLLNLFSKSDNIRKSMVSDVESILNKAILQRWEAEKPDGDSGDTFKVHIDCNKSTIPNTIAIKFTIEERTLREDLFKCYFFDLRECSEGVRRFFQSVIEELGKEQPHGG